MLDVLTAGAERTLVVPPLRPLRAPAPTVRAALAVYEAAEEHREGDGLDEDTARALARICAEWLPMRSYSVLFSEAFSTGRRLQALQALVAIGTPDWVAEQSGDGSSVDWHALIARYREAYGAGWAEVMDEPWHAFISQLRQTRRLQAREQVRFIRAYTSIRSQDGDSILQEIFEDAFLGNAKGDGEERTEEEEARRQQLRDELVAEAYQKRQHLLN